MKLLFRSIRIFALILVLLVSMGSKTVILVHFYSNRDSIAKEKCENKEKPEMKCNGKCYLAKQLKQTEEKKNEQAPVPVITVPELVFVGSPQFNFSFFVSAAGNDDPNFFNELSFARKGFLSIPSPPPRA